MKTKADLDCMPKPALTRKKSFKLSKNCMDKISKFLNRLSKAETEKLAFLISKIVANELDDLKVKKLKGFPDLYKIRYRKIRIVFRREVNKNVLVNIDYRNKVYK